MSKQKIVSGKAVEDVPNDAVSPEKPDFSLIDEAFLKSHIYTIRGVKIMLDADLAAIYGYETRKFNEQVKHNIEKFDDDFRFQLSDSEFTELKSNLMSKIWTSSWGGVRKLPFAFTELRGSKDFGLVTGYRERCKCDNLQRGMGRRKDYSCNKG